MAAAAAVTKRRATGTDGGGIAALPEELLHEVFSRVGGVKDIFLLARDVPAGQGHRARLLGFFRRRTKRLVDYCPSMAKMRAAQRTSVSPPTFLPAPGSPLGPTERALTSFVADDDGTFNYAQPLAARRGVVLMQLVPRTFNLIDRVIDTSPLLLGLFNPTTCERHVLPPLECSSGSRWCVDGYAIITAADGDELDGSSPPPPPSGRFTFSQLLLLATRQGSYQRYLHSYSAATRGWGGAPTACLDGRCLSLVGEGPAAVHRGAVHWLCNDDLKASTRGAPRGDHSLCKLSAELGGTARVSLAKLPVRAGGTPLLHVSRDGKLSVACMYPAHATVWMQQDGGGEDDAYVFLIPMAMAAVPTNSKDPPGLQHWLEEWYEFDRGSVLVLGRSGGVFVLDLEKKVIEKVMDCFPRLYVGKRHGRFVPYEMDLVEFFVSRLGGLLCRG
ncbi:hypothetical protein SETIT_1G081900v2 [Setaria italica]|uniref:F-box domain-containing protein n=1 Tax=Setaria italica TaxID=4555 RepID=K3Z0C5_SETIT|nr:hypothetical protein SETIT_1G081900v2 [Setaria italica]